MQKQEPKTTALNQPDPHRLFGAFAKIFSDKYDCKITVKSIMKKCETGEYKEVEKRGLRKNEQKQN